MLHHLFQQFITLQKEKKKLLFIMFLKNQLNSLLSIKDIFNFPIFVQLSGYVL